MSRPSEGPPPKPGEGSGYANVRERLVAMGYLARPLERYVLGGAARPGSFLRRHAAVSLRVAVAAGPLLGLLFALAVVVANRPRFSHARDFLVLAGGFTLVFGAVVFVLELAAGILLAAFVRWRGRGVAAFPATAARAGFAVSLALSAYLAYWWRRRAGDAGVVIDLAGLAVLALVNAALLRVSSLASLAALVRVSDLPAVAGLPSGEGENRQVGRKAPVAPARGARLLAPAALAAILLIAGFFIAPRSRGTEASPFERTPVSGRLIVIAWDGVPADELFLDHHGAGFPESALIEASWDRHRMRAPTAHLHQNPAALWTTVATGRTEHGITGLEATRPVGLSSTLEGRVPLALLLRFLLPGERVAVSSGFRSAPTVWEILGEREGVGSIGWWATWPAVERGGSGHPFDIVSDRALLALRRPSAGDFLIAPATLEKRMNGEFEADIDGIERDLQDAWVHHFFPAGSKEAAPGAEPLRGKVVQAAVIDGYALAAASKLLSDPAVRDLFVYLPGLDIARTAFKTAPDGEVPSGRFIGWYVGYVSRKVQAALGRLEDADRIVLLCSPGRQGSRREDAPWGWLMDGRVRGNAASTAVTLIEPGAEVDILDVAPTLLNLKGFPVSREMEGRSHARYPDESRRPAPIETYGQNTLPSIPFSASSEENEQETLERLRSLGYLN
jgi:hypothetical protein